MKTHEDPLAALDNFVRRQHAEEQGTKSLRATRIKMVLNREAKSVFFATLALRLETEPDWDIETLCTDGKHLWFNPDYVLSLSDQERLGVVAHEVLHCCQKHQARRGHRENKKWQIACDLAVNSLIREAGYTLPAGALFAGKGEYQHLPEGKSAEEYYSLLQQPQQPQEDGDGEGDGEGESPPNPQAGPGSGEGEGEGDSPPDPGKCGGVKDAGRGDQAARKESEAEWDVATAQAEQAAKSARGTLPAGISRMVAKMLQPQVDWKEVLREFVSRQARNDYAWTPPSKRFIHAGLYLPGMRSEELGDLVIAVDTSGSISEKVLTVFASEIQGILEGFDCKLTILYHDAEVAHVQEWQSTDGPLIMEPKGGGGTDHHPVFEYIEKMGELPTCLVCLTDLCSSFPGRPPSYPVLWCTTIPGTKGPWGSTVEVSV